MGLRTKPVSFHSEALVFNTEYFSFSAAQAAIELNRTSTSLNFIQPPPILTKITPFVNFRFITRSSKRYLSFPNRVIGFGNETFGGTSCANLLLM
jgi:hypothetical protein